MTFLLRSTLSSIAALALVACGSSDPVPSKPHRTNGSFVLEVNPSQASATLTTSQRALHTELLFDEDSSTLTNPPGTIQAVTRFATLPGASDPAQGVCPANTNCFTVDVTNFTSFEQDVLFMGIDNIFPATGRNLVGSDVVPPGASAALGGRRFGDLLVGQTATRFVNITLPAGDLSNYAVSGRFWGDFYVPSYGFTPIAECGSFCYFDEGHNINTTGNAGDQSLAAISSPGQLTDGLRGVNAWDANLGDGPAFEWVGWRGDSPTLNFQFLAPTEVNSLTFGINNTPAGALIRTPLSLAISFSDDGIAFSAPINCVPPAIPAATRADVVCATGGLTASFVRVVVASAGEWTFLDEVDFN